MSSNNNDKINAAYVALWKEKNPKLKDIKTDGHFLIYKNEKLDIHDIYMQDILINPNTFYGIETMDGNDVFQLIKLHVYATKIKEKELQEKTRRLKEYEYRANE